MELILKGDRKSIETLLGKNKRFIEKYEISVTEYKPVVKEKAPKIVENEVKDNPEEKPTVKRTRRTKVEIEADKNK